jgi:hypothetical protein
MTNNKASADHLLTTSVPEVFPECSKCDDTGYKDHASLALDPCPHGDPADPLEQIVAEALASRTQGPVTAGEIAAAIRASCLDIEPAGQPFVLVTGRMTAEIDRAMEALRDIVSRAAAHLGRMTNGGSSPGALPDIGIDPCKRERVDDPAGEAIAHIQAAYVKQQSGVPDQTALVWRGDLGKVLSQITHLRAWRETNGPGGAAALLAKAEAMDAALERIELNWERQDGGLMFVAEVAKKARLAYREPIAASTR